MKKPAFWLTSFLLFSSGIAFAIDERVLLPVQPQVRNLQDDPTLSLLRVEKQRRIQKEKDEAALRLKSLIPELMPLAKKMDEVQTRIQGSTTLNLKDLQESGDLALKLEKIGALANATKAVDEIGYAAFGRNSKAVAAATLLGAIGSGAFTETVRNQIFLQLRVCLHSMTRETADVGQAAIKSMERMWLDRPKESGSMHLAERDEIWELLIVLSNPDAGNSSKIYTTAYYALQRICKEDPDYSWSDVPFYMRYRFDQIYASYQGPVKAQNISFDGR